MSISCQQFRTTRQAQNNEPVGTEDSGSTPSNDTGAPEDIAGSASDVSLDTAVDGNQAMDTVSHFDPGPPPEPPSGLPTSQVWLTGAANELASPNYKIRFAFAPTRPVASIASPNYRIILGPHGGTK